MRQPLNHKFLTEDQLEDYPRMVIMVGLPRTGKSTYVNNFVKSAAQLKRAFTIVSSDDVRRAMGVRYDPQIEDQVQAYTLMMAQVSLYRRQNVVIDNTNLTRVERERWIALAKLFNYSWIIVEIEPLDEELHQSVCKEHSFPWEVIEAMKKRYEPVGVMPCTSYMLVTKEDRSES